MDVGEQMATLGDASKQAQWSMWDNKDMESTPNFSIFI